MKKNYRKFTFILTIMLLLVGICPTTVFATESKKQGNIEVKVREYESHAIPSVTKYLNKKYGTKHDPNKKIVQHTNVEIYYKGERIRDYHICVYQCPKCGKNGTLIYDYEDGIVDLHKCGDNKSRKELAQDGEKKVESLGKSALKDAGASAAELLIWAAVIGVLALVIIAAIAALPVLVLV